jgi:hypothetical protein
VGGRMGGGMGGRMHIRGVYRFSSLMKKKINVKNYAVFYFTGKRIFFFYIYDLITWKT